MIRREGISLRPFERCDLERYRGWVNNLVVASLVDHVLPVTKDEHERWYSALISNKNAVVFAIDVDGDYIGNVWLWDINWRHRKAEVRILIGEEDRCGRGSGTEALRRMGEFSFNRLNLNKLYAYVLESNRRAKHAFEKAGFTIEGVLQKDRFMNRCYQDVILLAKLRD